MSIEPAFPRRPVRVAVMVDLTRGPRAGGHVKCWERWTAAALDFAEQLDLTVYLSGPRHETIRLGNNARFITLPPVFSTKRLALVTGNLPDHTDLAPWHPALARQLPDYDVLHTTDAFFAFSRTALKVAKRHGLPLVNSIHTATPALTRMFTRQTITRLFGDSSLGRMLNDRLELPLRAEAEKQARLVAYQSQSTYALVSRMDDRARALTVLPPERVRTLRRGIDHDLFSPSKRDRSWLEAEFKVPQDRVMVLFVGRMDPSKNVMLLADGVRQAIDAGAPLHLVCAGEGPERGRIEKLLGSHVTCAGHVEPGPLGRIYASADLFALPSEIEVFGNVVLEALASGVPALVAGAGGMGFLIEPGRTGDVVGSGASAWAATLVRIAADPVKLALMRQAVGEVAATIMPSWRDILAEDLLPVWLAAAREGVSAPRVSA